MSECLFCLYHETRHTEEMYCPCNGNYYWESYSYCTWHDEKISDLEDEGITYGTGCEHYKEIQNE